MSRIKKYPYLFNEIKRNNETQIQIARLIGISKETMIKRMSGRSDWTISEIETICKHYNKDYYELFRKD